MGQLEDITKGAAVLGILPDGFATAIGVHWFGTLAVEAAYDCRSDLLSSRKRVEGRTAK